jgi:SLT domain-containing protein
MTLSLSAVEAIKYIRSRFKKVFQIPGVKSIVNGAKYPGYRSGGKVMDREKQLEHNRYHYSPVPLIKNQPK